MNPYEKIALHSHSESQKERQERCLGKDRKIRDTARADEADELNPPMRIAVVWSNRAITVGQRRCLAGSVGSGMTSRVGTEAALSRYCASSLSMVARHLSQ